MLSSTCNKGRSLFGLGDAIVGQTDGDGLVESLLSPAGKRFSINDGAEGYTPSAPKDLYAAYVIGSRAIGIETLNKTDNKEAGIALSNAILQSQQYFYQLLIKSGVLNASESDLSPIDDYDVRIEGELPSLKIFMTDKEGKAVSFEKVEASFEALMKRIIAIYAAFGTTVADSATLGKGGRLTEYTTCRTGTASGLCDVTLFNFAVEGAALTMRDEYFIKNNITPLSMAERDRVNEKKPFNEQICCVLEDAAANDTLEEALNYLKRTDVAGEIGIIDDLEMMARCCRAERFEKLEELISENVHSIRRIAQWDTDVFLRFIEKCVVGSRKSSLVFCPSLDGSDGVAWRVVYVTR